MIKLVIYHFDKNKRYIIVINFSTEYAIMCCIIRRPVHRQDSRDKCRDTVTR